MKPLPPSHCFKHVHRPLARGEALPHIPTLVEQLAWLVAHPLAQLCREADEPNGFADALLEDELAF